MSTPAFCCGFECGVDQTNAHWVLGTGGAFSTTTVRSGFRSLRANPTAAISANQLRPATSQTHYVWRVYVYFATLPNADCQITWVNSTIGGSNRYGVAFRVSDSKLYCATGTTPSFGATGVSVTTGVWYRVDVHVDFTSGARTVDGQVDGVALGQKTSTSNQAFATLTFGCDQAVSMDAFFEDVVLSYDAADYPFGPGFVNHFVPVADGTHNVAGANQFERGTTGTDITNATTDAFELVNEVPLDTGTPDADDYIAAIAPANATDYVEVIFGPAPGIGDPTLAPRAVEALLAYHQAAAVSGNIRIALVDNGTVDDILNQTATGSTSLKYARKHYAQPPSPTSGWQLGTGNGNFNDLRMRFYSSDADPDQYWDGAMIEAEFDGDPPTDGCTGELPAFETADQDLIEDLRALRAAGTGIEVFELVKVNWPAPTDPVYYAVLQTDDVASTPPPVSPIETRLIPDDDPAWFVPVELESSIGDEEVDLALWDGDGAISDLLVEHGEGIKVELFYWFPQVELLLPIWHGHLRQEDDAEIDICKLTAVQGFRASDTNLPDRAHWQECQAIFGAVFETQEEIDENDCPYNAHLSGGTTGNPGFTSCPRRTRADCEARLGNNGNYMLSHATQTAITANNQTRGPRLYSASFGNETSLKEPVRVVMGARRVYGMPVIAYRRDLNNNDPDHGFFAALYEACEGPIEGIAFAQITVGSVTQDADPLHYGHRFGELGQGNLDNALTVHGYSGTALIRYTFGWVNPEDVDPSQASASAFITGLNNIRVYTDDDTYTKIYSNNRAWQIAHMLTNKRWGFGYDWERLHVRSFLETACWASKSVRFTDFNGDAFDHIRSLSTVDLNGRKVQEQFEDMCMAGRFSRPFLFNGKLHIVPLRALSPEELAAVPVFTDEGINRNIIWEGEGEDEKTSLKRSRISDMDLPNRVECTFDDAENDYLETPVRPVEDVDAQLRAGRVVGDNSRKINVKKYPLLGVTVKEQAIKMAWSLLDLGPFDEGGLQNNLRLKFKIWFLDSLDLYPTKVIAVESSLITRYGFRYFRVVKINRLADLQVELEVQAYPEDYMAAFETVLDETIDPPAPTAPAPPYVLEFEDVTYSGGALNITISESPA